MASVEKPRAYLEPLVEDDLSVFLGQKIDAEDNEDGDLASEGWIIGCFIAL